MTLSSSMLGQNYINSGPVLISSIEDNASECSTPPKSPQYITTIHWTLYKANGSPFFYNCFSFITHICISLCPLSNPPSFFIHLYSSQYLKKIMAFAASSILSSVALHIGTERLVQPRMTCRLHQMGHFFEKELQKGSWQVVLGYIFLFVSHARHLMIFFN